MTTVSASDRAAWRKEAEAQSNGKRARRILTLLDALEAAERDRDDADKAYRHWMAAYEGAVKRAQAAEMAGHKTNVRQFVDQLRDEGKIQ